MSATDFRHEAVPMVEPDAEGVARFDLRVHSVRALNQFLHHPPAGALRVEVLNPDGGHAIGVGIAQGLQVDVLGHAGYYCGGMNQQAVLRVKGNVGPGCGENMMSGCIHVGGSASVSAGASMHGGLLVIDGDASLRCGISLKGGEIVVGGRVGSFSGFMAQAGVMVVCGDAGDALGDSLYEAVIYVQGQVASLGADAEFQPMQPADLQTLSRLLHAAGRSDDPARFRRIGSARTLYHWNADAEQAY